MGKECTTGRVTIPTDVDVVPETLELVKRWGADAIRDCDGTDYPEELKKVDAKVYATYYTTRKDNVWAKANPDEIQQMYIMTSFHTATKGELSIHLMEHLYPDMLKVNSRDDITRWWEVIDRTTGKVVPVTEWSYSEETGDVTIKPAKAFHDYTVSFLAYIMWDPVHMYNAVTNDWQGVEKQITFDVRQPKTKEYSKKRLRKFLESHPYVDVVRFTTFFHQFTLIFDELAREKYVDWYGYSASVSPYILEQFEQEVGYKGMLHQPDPEKKEDMLKGIIAIRDLHTRAVNETGFTCADEMLYPENHRYLSDLLSYVAIGARSVEDQQHRLTASGVGIPAGMKNPTGGDISVMMNSIIAAQHGHMFLYRGWEVKTPGNPYAHAILRGYVDKFGRNMPNYHYEDLQNLLEHYQEVNESAQTKLVNPAVIVDTNHSNSGKRFAEQIRISKDVMHSCKVSEDVHKLVKGLMIESYIEDGAQKVSEHCYGKSITDPCLGWEKTEKLIYELAELW